VDPVLGRVVVEAEQLVQIIGDLVDGLAELGAVREFERGGSAGAGGGIQAGLPPVGR